MVSWLARDGFQLQFIWVEAIQLKESGKMAKISQSVNVWGFKKFWN
jgi:hypothetical protein